ncbi:type II secretion system F family protein [Yersinia vastinensis]|uniref:type II secretion system F family protein n=1 Tax=Yersinia vastinensis TaxID=2890318 RepID=UPI0005E187E0|nr:type II secretion system F family protein [Yersinia vastinensis]OVZ97211.1 type II secretion system protein F [Yersinia frederiksenii]CNI57371.1 general secretion pathway protein [Yersinia frederiksenii]
MPVYKYAAINTQGVKVKGSIEAESLLGARQLLYQRKLCLLNIKSKRYSQTIKVINIFNRVNSMELVLITRQMSILINAAIPLDVTLEIIRTQNTKRNINKVICEVRRKVIEGYTFSDSLSLFPIVFNTLYRSMITAGEVSGHLDIVLSKLADHIEQGYKLKNKIIQALIYPMFLILISIGVIIILLSIVVPNIIEQFVLHDKSLPLSTKSLMTVSYWVKDYILIILLMFTACLILFNGALRVRKIKILFEHYYLKIPMLGKAISRLNISRYLRMMNILNSNGVSLIQAMKISGTILTNQYIKQQLSNSVKLVSEGGSLSTSLADSRIFPSMILHMIASGERSGQLDSMLEKIADIQEQELVDQISVFITMLEPLIMIFMAGFIFFIVLAIFQPILEMNNLIL